MSGRKVKPVFTTPQASVVRYALAETVDFWASERDELTPVAKRALAELDRAMNEANPLPPAPAPARRQLERGSA